MTTMSVASCASLSNHNNYSVSHGTRIVFLWKRRTNNTKLHGNTWSIFLQNCQSCIPSLYLSRKNETIPDTSTRWHFFIGETPRAPASPRLELGWAACAPAMLATKSMTCSRCTCLYMPPNHQPIVFVLWRFSIH